MFASNRNKGFAMTFENGWTISVQWGVGNYCNVGRSAENYNEPTKHESWKSETAEIAIWDKNDNWYNFEHGDAVKGYCTANEVAEWILVAATLK